MRFRLGWFVLLLLCCSTLEGFAEPGAADVNAIIGFPLFASESLWEESDTVVAERLRWRQESETSYSRSFRVYPNEDARFLGVRPYSMALYGGEGKPVSVSIVFANKGDFGGISLAQRGLQEGAVGRERSELRKQERQAALGLGKAIDQDAATLEQELTELFGKPEADRFGQGQGMKERVLRWNWKGHAFLLSKQLENYVGLRIVPTQVADNGGRDTRVSDAELKQRLKTRVEHRPNGDVVIGDMPMVDQGPKGFCVPATIERCLRYMGIQSDMYVLALAAHTGAGGGTSMDLVETAIMPLLRVNLRKYEVIPPSMSTSSVARTIDQGVPIIWALLVDDRLDTQLTDRAKQRRNTPDVKTWKEVIKPARKEAKRLQPPRTNGHVCLIIGYNPDTNELAISDSWGPQYAERWITVEEAEAISQHYLRAITW